MGLYESLKQNNKNKTIKLYDVMLEESSIDEYDLFEYITRSWEYASQHCNLSVLAIKALADYQKLDWKKLFSLQFYDQLYHDDKIKKTNRRRRQRDNNQTSTYAGHCVAFGCLVDGTVMNGQTWDTMNNYPDTDVFTYPSSKTVSHHGALGSSYISKNRYSVCWTGTKTKECRMNAIPSPIFLFEAMNNENIKNIEDFIEFESKFLHSCSHCLSITDGEKLAYLERTDNNVNVTRNVVLPFAHCNTFLNSCYKNSIKDSYSLQRIKVLQKLLNSVDNVTETYLHKILTNKKHVWIEDDDWLTISAYIYNPKTYVITYFDKRKVLNIQ